MELVVEVYKALVMLIGEAAFEKAREPKSVIIIIINSKGFPYLHKKEYS